MVTVDAPRTALLVEGNSDRAALHALAAREQQGLAGVDVIPMGGITNIRTFALHFGPRGLGMALAGLYDAGEEGFVRRGLVAAGLPSAAEPGGLERLGFFRCEADLEDELIRALGVDGVEAVIDAAGERRSLERLRQMPAQQGWTPVMVLRRFLGSKSGRKAKYAALMVDALATDRVPAPLRAVLDRSNRDF